MYENMSSFKNDYDVNLTYSQIWNWNSEETKTNSFRIWTQFLRSIKLYSNEFVRNSLHIYICALQTVLWAAYKRVHEFDWLVHCLAPLFSLNGLAHRWRYWLDVLLEANRNCIAKIRVHLEFSKLWIYTVWLRVLSIVAKCPSPNGLPCKYHFRQMKLPARVKHPFPMLF